MLTRNERTALLVIGSLLLLGWGARYFRNRQADLTGAGDSSLRATLVQLSREPEEAPDSTSSTFSPSASSSSTQLQPATRISEKKRYNGKLDLNRASTEELMRINGIGEKTAWAIVKRREEKGRFQDVSDLLEIKGIGPKKLERMRPYLLISP